LPASSRTGTTRERRSARPSPAVAVHPPQHPSHPYPARVPGGSGPYPAVPHPGLHPAHQERRTHIALLLGDAALYDYALRAAPVGARRSDGLAGRTLKDIERQAIQETLKLTGGNKAETAKRLGISRRALYDKIEKYGLK